jgi:APA family basic amino acid/polyamine antiporter
MPTDSNSTVTKPVLRRDLGLIDAVGVGLGAIIGAGIFVVTGVAAGVAGPAFLLGLLLAGVAAACNALSSAQLAATYPQSGGTYEYGYRVLTPWAGFAAGWMFLASKLAAGGTVALGFASYLERLVPGLPLRPAAVAAVVALTIANLFGIKKAGRFNTSIVFVTVSALVYFVLAGLPHFRADNLQPFAPSGFGGILQAAALLFFAFTGYARIATLGEEVHNPKTTIPRAIIISLSVAALLYVGVALIAVGTIGAPAMAASASPLIDAARTFSAPAISPILGVGAVTAMLGVLLSQIVGISRVMLAMARRGDFPPALGHVSEAHAVPDRGILLTGSIIALLAIFGTLQWVVATATFTILLYYGITNVAALRMAPEDRLFPRVIPIIGLITCLLLAVSLPPRTIALGIALLAAGFALRWLLRRIIRKPS